MKGSLEQRPHLTGKAAEEEEGEEDWQIILIFTLMWEINVKTATAKLAY